LAFGPAVFNRYCLALFESGFLQDLTECGEGTFDGRRRYATEEADHRKCRLLLCARS
jgi:hypothetical protein